MTASQRTQRATASWVHFSLALILLLSTGGPLFGSTSSSTNSNNSSDSSGDDLHKKYDSANIASLIGAIGAGVSCALLLKAASEEENQSTKTMYQAMAAQQCAQSAANAASAADNDSGSDATTDSNDNGQQTTGNNASSEKPSSTTPTYQASAGQEPKQEPERPSQVVNPDQYKPDSNAFDQKLVTTPTTVPEAVAGMSKLNPIEWGKVRYDDSAKGNEPSIRMPLGDSTSTFAFFGTRASDDASKEKADSREKHDTKGNSAGSAAPAGGSQSAPVESNEKEGSSKNANMQALLRLMNEDPLSKLKLLQGKGLELANGRKVLSKTANIFEYASYRYRRLRDDGLIHLKNKGRYQVSNTGQKEVGVRTADAQTKFPTIAR